MSKKKFTIVPVPYEETTTYGKGTKNGPAAILKALPHVEEFDHELKAEIFDLAELQTLRPVTITDLGSRIANLQAIPVILGGEHSLTPRVVKAMAKKHKNLSVLQLDAHADLRNHYKGRKDNHACVMRRVLEICPAVQVGIRDISKWGYLYAQRTGQLGKIHFLTSNFKLPTSNNIVKQLSKDVYMTIDVDVFDPSVVPAVGTPEPGGLGWGEVLSILKAVCRKKNVVGFDVVELCPRKGDIVSDFTVAKLVYKVIGYISAGKSS